MTSALASGLKPLSGALIALPGDTAALVSRSPTLRQVARSAGIRLPTQKQSLCFRCCAIYQNRINRIKANPFLTS